MSHRFAIWTAVLLLIGIGLLSVGFWIYEKFQDLSDLESVESLIEGDFPDITHITGEELETWLADPQIDVLIVDCRKPKEFSISHLPDAVNLTSARDIAGFLEENDRSPDHIVAYCSVGWRSSKLVQALEKKSGIENAANLRGAIFRWANDNRPLKDSEGNPTEKVHPYHSFWAKLLEPGKAATE